MPDYLERSRLLASIPSMPFWCGFDSRRVADEIGLRRQTYLRLNGLPQTGHVRRVPRWRPSAQTGRDLLHLMAALGQAGEAPAEALGGLLAAAREEVHSDERRRSRHLCPPSLFLL